MVSLKRGWFPRLIWGGVGILVALVVAVIVLPTPFIRMTGCSGDLDHVEVFGSKVLIAEKLASTNTQLQREKVTIFDAASGQVVAGPFVHRMEGWAGLLGDLYCLGGSSLMCAPLATGDPVVTRETLDGKSPLLKGHWPDDPSRYWSSPPDKLIVASSDGRFWALDRQLALSATTERDSPRASSSGSTARGANGVEFVGEGREHLKALTTGALSANSWLEPEFLVDRTTGQVVQTPGGWLMSSIERRTEEATFGNSVSSVNQQGVEAWRTALGDGVSPTEATVVGDVVVFSTVGDRVTVQALELATGKPRWSHRYNFWPW